MASFAASFSDFRAAIPGWIDWTGSTTTQLNDLIKVGEEVVYKRLRVRQMEVSLSATVGADGTVTVPTDYLEMKHARMDTSPVRKLERKSPEFIYENYADRSVTGNEQYFARDGSSFIFGSAGAAGRVMKGGYWGKPTSMADSSTINSVFSAHPDLFLMATLSESAPFIGMDARMPVWKSKFEELLAAANAQAKAEDKSGSTLAATRG